MEHCIEGDISPEQQLPHYEGNVHVTGSLKNNSSLIAAGDIIIDGSVRNAFVHSINGSIFIHGGIAGTASEIIALGDIKAQYLSDATISCMGTLYINDMISNATVYANNAVMVETGNGLINGGRIIAGREINTRIIGSDNQSIRTDIRIENRRQREMYETLIAIERHLAAKRIERGKLRRMVSIVQQLGKRVVNLPEAKKRELAQQLADLKQVQNEINRINTRKKQLEDENNDLKKVIKVIRVKDTVYPGVCIEIENSKLSVQEKYHAVVFYKSGIVIAGRLDLFRERMRRLMEG